MEPNQDNSGESQTSWTPDFSKYLQDKWKRGVDIDQNPSDYVTEDILTNYWKEATVCDVLDNGYYQSIPIDAATIIAHFLRVWSTLVFIGRPQYITWFHQKGRDDEYFYASSFSQTSDQDSSLQEMLKIFSQQWYRFWPVRFRHPIMHNRDLDSQRVLPVVSSQQLSHPGSKSGTTIHEVILDPQCCEKTNQKVIFKIYTDPGPPASAAFRKEVDIFATLGANGKDFIVDYLGSFIQNRKRVIILEHANGGNLRDFFQSHRGPRNNDEMIQLWTKLFKLSDAVYHLHHLGRAAVSVAHRDIKFENILVFKNEKNDYDFHFKLTDFDTSTGPQKVDGGSSHQDNDGSRTRCAPEASRILDHTEHKAEKTPLDSDIWQLGTVFSEALVCILWDYKSLATYEKRRREETSTFRKLGDSGLEICFHDGQKRLACIEDIHQEALDSRKRFDRISEPLVALIEDHMLVPHEARLPAKLLSVKFAQLVERLRRDSVVISDALPPSQQRQLNHAQTEPGAVPGVREIPTEQDDTPQKAIRDSPSSHTIESSDKGIDRANGVPQEETEITRISREEPLPRKHEDSTARPAQNLPRAETELSAIKFPVVTANDVKFWRRNKKKRGASAPPGVIEIIDQLHGREQVIVIDDAKSMQIHLSDIIQMVGDVISLAKKADPNGVELIFTSAPDDVKKRSKFRFKSETSHLVDRVEARFRDGSLPHDTHMEDRLGTVLERIARSGKPTSVYVLTNGVWQESDEPGGGVENPIKTLISHLNDRKRNRTAVTIQFIRFGDDAEGCKRLKWLDDELPNSGENYLRKFDIVDTRHHGDNLYLVMIGAHSRKIDQAR